MVNREILEGIRSALARGYTLEKAMMSFYNSGYKKEEIEEAARALYKQPTQSKEVMQKKPPIKTEIKKPEPQKPQLQRAIPEKKEIEKPTEKSKISNYEIRKKPKGRFLTILLIVILVILLGALAAVFIFREELINYFNNAF